MYHFEDLLHQPLAVVFIDEVEGKERWQVQTGVVVPAGDGCAFLIPPSTKPAFQLLPEWEDRLRVISNNMLGNTEAKFAIYVRVLPLPPGADLADYSSTDLNLNS